VVRHGGVALGDEFGEGVAHGGLVLLAVGAREVLPHVDLNRGIRIAEAHGGSADLERHLGVSDRDGGGCRRRLARPTRGVVQRDGDPGDTADHQNDDNDDRDLDDEAVALALRLTRLALFVRLAADLCDSLVVFARHQMLSSGLNEPRERLTRVTPGALYWTCPMNRLRLRREGTAGIRRSKRTGFDLIRS
jgi:hypothetical protein